MLDAGKLADMLSQAIETANAPLLARIAALERQKSAEPVKGEPGEKGSDGRDADMTLVLDLRREIESLRGELALVKSVPSLLIDDAGELVAAQNGQLQKLGRVRGRDAEGVTVDVEAIAKQAAALIPAPKDGANGKDAAVDLEALALKAAALVPKPSDGKDGRDVELATVQTLVAAEVVKAVSGLPAPKDGASVTLSDVEPLVRVEVQKAVASLPAPTVAVTPADVEPFIRAEVTKAVAQIQPREPVGIVGAITDRSGHLILTKSDGATIDAGVVIGRDGADADMDQIAKSIEAAVAKIPRPNDGKDGQDGADGKDGADGFGFDDMDVVVDEVRKGCFLRFTKGDRVKEFRIKGVPMHCGVYDDSQEYFKGNEVTRGGSTWLMQADHVKGVKPDDTPESRKVWKLAAMRGKEGKQGQRGPEGPAGKNLTWEDRIG